MAEGKSTVLYHQTPPAVDPRHSPAMQADTVDQLILEFQGDAEREQLALELQGKLCNALTQRLDEGT
jgi:hypothetical protein